jgi:RNA 2',3'-cyclic 3'-phosphodiesterase
MRLFLAIGAQNLSFDPLTELKKIRVGLEKKAINYRWVPVSNLHITINFIGEVEEQRVPDIINCISPIAAALAPFQLSLANVDAFPEERKGRVIWLGVQNSVTLRSLQQQCQAALLQSGFELELRDYRPHLTVARLRSPVQLRDILSPYKRQHFGELTVQGITLYQSTLSGPFPHYGPLHQFSFNLTEHNPS